MRLRFEVYEANVRGSPVEFSFSASRTSREELRARGARRTRKMRREFGARYVAPSGSYGGGMIYLCSLWVESCKSEGLAGGRGGTRGVAGPGTNALYS